MLESGISDNDRRLDSDLPLRTGFVQTHPGTVQLANLWLALLRAFGGNRPPFVDGTGVWKHVTGWRTTVTGGRAASRRESGRTGGG